MKKQMIGWASLGIGVGLVLSVPCGGWAEPDQKQSTTTATSATTSSPPTSSAQKNNPAASESTTPATTTKAVTASGSSASPTEASATTTSTEAENGGAGASTETAQIPAPASNGLISVDFKDADVRQVLRIISLKSGVDIVAGTDVEGLVTIKLTNVPWEQALEIILRTYGFTYERKGNIVRVMTVEALEGEALSTEVFPLGYAKAKDVPDILKEMLSDRGRVKFDERTNTVIVTDIPTNLFQIKQVIERLDQRTPQVLIETKIVETKLDKDENLGIDWTPSTKATLKQTIPDVQSSFPFKPNGSLGTLGRLFGAQRAPGPTQTAFTLGTLTTPDLNTTLNFLKTRTDTHIISNPNISVLNNQQANIHIGEEYPVPSYSIDPTTGKTTISGYSPKQTGTVLTVTPHVNPNKEIVVDLKPEIVTVGAPVSYSLGGTSGSVEFPRFTAQTAQTQVRIQSGQTIAIGGLVKSSEGKVEAKIPILGDIPVVGMLFKNTHWYSGTSDPVRQDVLIFLTVNLMEEKPLPSDQQKVAAAPATDATYHNHADTSQTHDAGQSH